MVSNAELNKLVNCLINRSSLQIQATLLELAKKLAFPIPPMLENAQKASVIIPIILHPSPTLLLIERSESLRLHASQIGFPGGKQDDNEDAKTCALREVQEELGISKEHIKILTDLGEWPSNSGFSITPFIGFIDPPLSLTLSLAEVKSTFELPVAIAFNLQNYQRKRLLPEQRDYFELCYEDKKIWGFSANILALLAALVQA